MLKKLILISTISSLFVTVCFAKNITIMCHYHTVVDPEIYSSIIKNSKQYSIATLKASLSHEILTQINFSFPNDKNFLYEVNIEKNTIRAANSWNRPFYENPDFPVMDVTADELYIHSSPGEEFVKGYKRSLFINRRNGNLTGNVTVAGDRLEPYFHNEKELYEIRGRCERVKNII